MDRTLPGVNNALNWNAATAITAWGGVTVAGTPARVRAIDLDWAGLAGRIEPQLSWLSALEQLRLAGNALSGMIPASLGRTTQAGDGCH